MPKPKFPPERHGRPRTAWAVICVDVDEPKNPQVSHGLVYLTEQEYVRQLDNADALWKCPICRCSAVWSDLNYQNFLEVKRA